MGDDCGNVTLYDTTRNGMNEASMSAASYRRGQDPGRHSDWVTKVEYFSDLNLMISSSLDGTLKIGELEGLIAKKVAEDRRDHERPIAHDAHAGRGQPRALARQARRLLVRVVEHGEAARLVRPGADDQPLEPVHAEPEAIGRPVGHTASVLHVAINDEGFQLFSCSVDKCIKVWDLRTHKCLQTVYDKTPYRPEDRITSMAFDATHSRLLTGTTKPARGL